MVYSRGTGEEYRLHEFQGYQNSFLDSETIGRTPVLEELEKLFEQHSGLTIRAISDLVILQILDSDVEIDRRIYQFPKAALKVRGEKIGYYQFFEEEVNKDCDESLLRIVPKIDIKKLHEIVDDTPGTKSPVRMSP